MKYQLHFGQFYSRCHHVYCIRGLHLYCCRLRLRHHPHLNCSHCLSVFFLLLTLMYYIWKQSITFEIKLKWRYGKRMTLTGYGDVYARSLFNCFQPLTSSTELCSLFELSRGFHIVYFLCLYNSYSSFNFCLLFICNTV